MPITASGVLYRAFDAFLGGSDTDFGFTQVVSASDHRTAVGCSVNPNNSPADKIEELIPLTGDNNYFEDEFDFVWSAIGSQMPFADTAAPRQPGQRGRDQLEFPHPGWSICQILAPDVNFCSGIARARDFQDC